MQKQDHREIKTQLMSLKGYLIIWIIGKWKLKFYINNNIINISNEKIYQMKKKTFVIYLIYRNNNINIFILFKTSIII